MAKLAQRLLKDPVRVEIAGKKTTLEAIEQRLHAADDMQHKNRILNHLIADSGMTRAIIFSGTKRNADQLARELTAQGHSAAALHGDMNQNARNRTIMNMRRGKIRLLVATDVAARGLDVTGITHVINYDLPKNAEDYVHRIGRTGTCRRVGHRHLLRIVKGSRFAARDRAVHRPDHPAAGDPGPGAGAPFAPLKQREQRRDLRQENAGRAPRQAGGTVRTLHRRNSFGSKPGRKPNTDTRFNRDEKRSVKSDGGKFSDFRGAKPGRQSRWA